jgi:hypothetical protein
MIIHLFRVKRAPSAKPFLIQVLPQFPELEAVSSYFTKALFG